MSEILKSPTRNQRKSSIFFCWCFLMSHFILKLFPQTWHFQLDLYDYSYGKDISGNAMSKVWKIFQEEMKITVHLQKSTWFFLVPGWRFQYFRHILQNPNLKLMAGFPNNHYWSYTFLNPWALKKKIYILQ